MEILSDFPLAYTRDLKLKTKLSDEVLQDLCNVIAGRMNQVVSSGVPKVSILFPAYNEELYLPLMLWSLSRLSSTVPMEIIGVNNASDDRTGEIIEQCGIMKIDEKRKGVSYARQAGLENAKGVYIASTDADTHVPSDWIHGYLEYFDNIDDLVCASGGTNWQGVHESYFFFQRLLRLIKKRKITSRVWQFPGANSFFRRSAATSVGGYEAGSDLWEDVIISNKMKTLGKTLRIENDPRVRAITSARRSSNLNRTIKTCIDYALKNGKSGVIKSGETFLDVR